MQFIVLDLEWNNVYLKSKSGFFNEIIEIGAVKLDENCTFADTFTCIIRPRCGTKLKSNIKRLTNLTNHDLSLGVTFDMAISSFKKWINDDETIFLTWGDSDIRVLAENFSFFKGLKSVPFIKCYCDLQKYYHHHENIDMSNQAGLTTAAVQLGIDPEAYSHHRALEDSLLTADIFSVIFDEELMINEAVKCNEEYFRKFFEKPKAKKKRRTNPSAKIKTADSNNTNTNTQSEETDS